MSAAIRYLGAIVILSALLLSATRLSAQTTSGSISGTAVDASGAVLPGVQIRVINQGTKTEVTATTDNAGAFRLNLLPAGVYALELTKEGFQTKSLSDISVAVSVDRGLGNIRLDVGSVSQKVVVNESSAALVETTQAQISATFDNKIVQTFVGSQEGQGLDSMFLMLPGVVNARDASFSNSNSGTNTDFQSNGNRARNNDQEIDGQNNNDNSVSGPAVFVSDPDFIQETQVITGNFGAEYGRNSGSVINQVTKSGTNNWHGTISGTENNSAFNTLSNTDKFYDGLTKLPRTNNEFTSSTVGGPIRKDHAFIFGGFNDNIISSATDDTGEFTPTLNGVAELAGCFPGSSTVALLESAGPFAISGGNPSIVPGTLVTETIDHAGVPNAPAGTGGIASPCNVDLAQVQRTLGTSEHVYDWVTKFDLNVGQNRFYARYLFQKSAFFNQDIIAGYAAAGYPFSIPALAQNVVLGWSRTLTSSMTNELRVGYGRTNVTFAGNTIGTVPSLGDQGNALTNMVLGNDGNITYQGLGVPDGGFSGRIVNTWQAQDNWAYVHGRNQWKAGVNFTYEKSPNNFLPGLDGLFSFNPYNASSPFPASVTPTGCTTINPGDSVTALSALACNVPQFVGIASGTPTLDFSEKDLFVYGGDDIKIKDNLTINLGLTWTYFGQPANLFHDLTVARESNPATAFWNTSLPLADRTFPELSSLKDLFGPSVGFAWTPRVFEHLLGHDKTVIRGGYRLSVDPPFYNPYLLVADGPPQLFAQTVAGVSSSGTVIGVPPSGTGAAVRSELSPFLTPGVLDPRSGTEVNLGKNFGPDRVHGWSLGVQHEFTQHLVVESRYVGNHGFDLFQAINGNPYVTALQEAYPNLVPAGVTGCTAPTVAPPPGSTVSPALGRVNCSEGIDLQYANTAYSDYNAVQTEVRASNLFNQLTFTTNYSYSKTTDNASEIFFTLGAGNTTPYPQNPFDYTKGEHALSGLDVPQQWTLNLVEDIPFFKGQNGVVGRILGGWTISGNYVMASGQPYTPIQFNLATFSGGLNVDSGFNQAVAGINDSDRPFVGSLSAPTTSIGVFAGDACSLTGLACTVAPNTLTDFTQVNTYTGAASAFTPTMVSKNQVRLIVNGGEAESIFGTPFGNATRNSLRDARQNIANFGVFKSIKFNERSRLILHMSMINAFNHPNFSSILPILDAAGGQGFEAGFGIPQQFPGTTSSFGQRQIFFGAKIVF
ncbi:MAG: TonB-dependent receptor [Candidatus Acidiferrales bacterium]